MTVQNHSTFKVIAPEWLASYSLARSILSLAHQQPDRRVTYGDIWILYHGVPQPVGQWWIRKFRQPLTDLGNACMGLGLPMLSALIVQKSDRCHSAAAVANMCRFMEANGVQVGPSQEAFVREQAEQAANLTLLDLDRAFQQNSL